MNRLSVLSKAFLIALVCLTSAVNASGKQNNDAIDSSRQQELRYFVKHDCGSCHGLTMKGGLGPALLPETLKNKPDAWLVSTVMNGRDDTAMPPWNTMLDTNEARWIVQQLKSGKLLAAEKRSQIARNKP